MFPAETVKSRDLNKVLFYPATERVSAAGKVVNPSSFPKGSTIKRGRQFTTSINHRKNRKGKYDSGGPFFTTRVECDIPTRSVRLKQPVASDYYVYNGPINIPVPDPDTPAYLPAPSQDSSYLDTYGATAIRIVDPTNPNAQFGVAAGEILKDRFLPIPAIQAWRRRTEVAKAASGEYLNAVFGWLPLVRDMKNTAQSILDGNKIMENYQAASGTLVHREFAFDDIVTETSEVYKEGARCVYSANSIIAPFNAPGVPIIRHSKKTTKRWFSGSFTYHSGDGNDLQKCIGIGSRADKLFGTTLTPDIVWELVPWSWAIDWVSNAGDVISNATSFGLAGLVMKYGYIMEETSIVDTYSMPSTAIKGVTGPPPDCTVTQVTKRRREANPFGFGITWEGLSPTQLAITAALGITRLR